MIKIRIDDVMCESDAWTKERSEHRFKTIHEWIAATNGVVIHVPTIICKDIQNFPKTIEFIKEQTSMFKMFPEIHGWEHINYDELEEEDIYKHLLMCLTFFEREFNIVPTIWALPWGGEGNEAVQSAANKAGLTIESAAHVIAPSEALHRLQTEKIDQLNIMTHWWSKGNDIRRICEICTRKV